MQRPDPHGPYRQPPAWQQPPPGRHAPPGWGPPPAPEQNGLAIAGVTCSGTSLAFFLLLGLPTFGISFVLSLPLAIAGLVCGLMGRQKVDRGELRQGRDMAQVGFVLGIVSVVLHALAIAIGIVLIGLLIDAIGDFDLPDPDQAPEQTTPSAV